MRSGEGVSRRTALKWTATACLAAAGPRPARAEDQTPPLRTITRGPRHHWFGYYDKLEFDPTSRYVLGMAVDFEHRSPRPDDVIRIGMVDLQDGDRWIELGESTAWCWQQGCMLQWRPGSASEILWNDRQGDRYVCHVLDVRTRAKRTIPAIYTVSPDGRWAVTPDFRRLADVRPGYGYNGLPDPHAAELAPRESGIWRVDLETGEQKLLISLADIVQIPSTQGDTSAAKHWFNHLLINPDGTRFEFLHRWQAPGDRSFSTRMMTAAPDGSAIRVLNTNTSHFIWRDPQHVLAWAWHASHGNAFYIFEDRDGGSVERLPPEAVPPNGHISYLPGGAWILCDSYPDKERKQQVCLYHVEQRRRVNLGAFPLPREYAGEWRCDFHPRFSPDGRWVVFDSPHTGQGRQLQLIDVGAIVRA